MTLDQLDLIFIAVISTCSYIFIHPATQNLGQRLLAAAACVTASLAGTLCGKIVFQALTEGYAL